MALPYPESPTFATCLTFMLPQFASEPMFKIPDDQHYTLYPTYKLNDLYCSNKTPAFLFNTEKPVVIEEQEDMAQKLTSLDQAMRNLQGLRGYKSVSYKDMCMFLGANLPIGFKMPKFEKYNGHDG